MKRGYLGNEIFDHTMDDITRVLEHKISMRNQNQDMYAALPEDYKTFKQLDSDSEEESEGEKEELDNGGPSPTTRIVDKLAPSLL